MAELTIKRVGLAAYLLNKQQRLVRFDVSQNTFIFDSDRDSASEWEREYTNSDEFRFNANLIHCQQLRRIANGNS